MGDNTPLSQWLEAISPRAVAGISLLAVALLGLADVATGAELSSSVFYALPVSLAAWYAGPRHGLALAVMAAATWYGADLAAGATYSAAWIPVWNSSVRLAFFVIIAGLLVRLRKALDEQRALAERDPLTGLANGRRFREAVASELARSTRYRRPVSLAYVDLDGFKGVNDKLGHQTGDEVLTSVGRLLGTHVRRSDLPARLGGDEFAILFPETDAASAREAVTKLHGNLTHAMADSHWPVGFSIGVVTSVGDVDSGLALLRLADALMYEVKHSGKGRATFRTVGRHDLPQSQEEPGAPG